MSEKTFDITYLSDNLVELLSDIQNNMEITLTRHGVPLAKVLPISPEKSIVKEAGLGLDQMSKEGVLDPKIGDLWQGKVKVADNFDETSEEVIAAVYGEQTNLKDLHNKWNTWFEEVDNLKILSSDSQLDNYGSALLEKYRNQGLDV
ncbi:type II toxin-antitoxin system Phd/YefM family antitoxin [Anabaena azotica]|uniref:type II toxin-antitoxin system Phd/YefM family antitoxin n=1 Tax=Anabaena azotica TaxID=197653 RepID=UPI0039A5BDC3